MGIEVPNEKREKVRLRELISSGAEGMTLPMFLGKDSSGEPLVADLVRMPHMLIMGTTGSGKSVCINTVIMSWLFMKRPDELKLILVDPKMVELSQFGDIPHLACPVITETGKAAASLAWAVKKMEERYELLREAGVRDLPSYNNIPWEEKKEIFQPGTELEEAKIPRKPPYIVFVIDELADLMMSAKEVEQHILFESPRRASGRHPSDSRHTKTTGQRRDRSDQVQHAVSSFIQGRQRHGQPHRHGYQGCRAAPWLW